MVVRRKRRLRTPAGVVAEVRGASTPSPSGRRDRGNARRTLAQVDLGTAHDQGLGVEQSYREAAHGYRRAAEPGEVAGQFNLASLYEQGQGVAKDPSEAYAWYYLAVRQGIGTIGAEGLARLSSQLTKSEVDRSIAKALRYKAGYAK